MDMFKFILVNFYNESIHVSYLKIVLYLNRFSLKPISLWRSGVDIYECIKFINLETEYVL